MDDHTPLDFASAFRPDAVQPMAKADSRTPLRVTVWRTVGGHQLEEVATVDGSPLPAGVSRWLAFGMILIQQIGAPTGVGQQVPFRFTIEDADAPDVHAALAAVERRMPEESDKAFRQWEAQQRKPQLAFPTRPLR